VAGDLHLLGRVHGVCITLLGGAIAGESFLSLQGGRGVDCSPGQFGSCGVGVGGGLGG